MPSEPADTTETLPTDEEPNEGSMRPVAPTKPEGAPLDRQSDLGDGEDRRVGEQESHDRRL